MTNSEALLLALTLVFAVLVTALHLSAVTAPDRGRYTVTAQQTVPRPGVEERINVNTADAETLERLPGIGPALAERIVAEREANGPFSDAADLTRVSGIGEKTAQALIPYVTVGEELLGEEMTESEDSGG